MRILLTLLLLTAAPALAQTTDDAGGEVTSTDQAVDLEPGLADTRIAKRIAQILDATGWYSDASVRVEDSIAFLDGTTTTTERKTWARDLAAKTTGVVAVVNRIEVEQAVELTIDPAVREVRVLKDQLLAALPSIALALLILPLAWFTARVVRRLLSWSLRGRTRSPFIADILARLGALPVLLLGLYLVLQIAGLTQLALSVVGGAGVLGIVIGFAFRDIAENFLASLLLSLRQPFARGDLINVAGQSGVVHSMNTRSTVLVSVEGNHIQIPNATVFKSIIENLTAVPRRRGELDLGIGYDAAISDVQRIVNAVLSAEPGVLKHPEPMVLADTLGASTVNVKIYYWFDGAQISPLKLRSALVRQIKQTLMDAGISMPDEAREIIFPEGIPLQQGSGTTPDSIPAPKEGRSEMDDDLSTEDDLEEQLQVPIEGSNETNLLR